jgi:hypothetical protein
VRQQQWLALAQGFCFRANASHLVPA